MAVLRLTLVLACLCTLSSASYGREKGTLVASLPGGECAPRDKYIAFLKDKHHEGRLMGGLDSRGALIELFTSKDGETWTLLVTWASGISCLVGSGQTWVPVGKPGEPS